MKLVLLPAPTAEDELNEVVFFFFKPEAIVVLLAAPM